MLSRPLASGHRSLLGTEEEEERFWLKETVNYVRYLKTIMREPRGDLSTFVRYVYCTCVVRQKKKKEKQDWTQNRILCGSLFPNLTYKKNKNSVNAVN